MTDTILDPDAGSLARIIVRLALLAASVAGLTIGDRWLVVVQAGVELALLIATAVRARGWRQVSWARLGRACARPAAIVLVLTRWHPSEADLLALVAGAEMVVLALQQWWRATKKGSER